MTKWQTPEWINPEAWAEFEEHRKSDAKLRKGWSDLARRKCANKLQGLTHEQQQECVDQSIMCGWSGLFPPKQKEYTFKEDALPKQDNLLESFAKQNGMTQPRPGEYFDQYRQRLTDEMRRH